MKTPVPLTKTSSVYAQSQVLELKKSSGAEDIAQFIVGNLIQRTRWMWKRYEIANMRGLVELMKLRLAEYWRIDDVYLVQNGIFSLDLESLAMELAGYRIEDTSDGGYWLLHYYHRVGYYRRRGMAVRRAMKEIGSSSTRNSPHWGCRRQNGPA